MITDKMVLDFLAAYQPSGRDLVFDWQAPFHDIRGWLVAEDAGAIRIHCPSGGMQSPAVFGQVAPSLFWVNGAHPKFWGELTTLWMHVRKALFARPVSEAELLGHCASLAEPQAIRYVIGSGLAAGYIRLVPGRKQKFTLAEITADHVGRNLFSGTLSDEFNTTHARLELLIKHMPTIGSYRETLLRSFLARHLPKRYHVATGFILGKLFSPKGQIDVLIYDQENFTPVFREGDLVVVPVEAVRAAIEVKTRLWGSELDSALALLDNNTRREIVYPPFFKGVFAFQPGIADPRKVAARIASYYNGSDPSEFGPIARQLSHAYQAVDAVVVPEKLCVLSRHEQNLESPELVNVRPAEGDPFTSAFLCSLLGYLDIPAASKRAMLDSLSYQQIGVQPVMNVHNSSWTPTFFRGEWSTPPSGQQELRKVVRAWHEGLIDFPRGWDLRP